MGPMVCCAPFYPRHAARDPTMSTLLYALGAYLIGSISFAVVISRLFGLPDPHSYGSGNPGATNVLRTGNKAAAGLTLLGDGAKGWAAVALAQALLPRFPAGEWALGAVALAVFVGHLFPVFHGFKGGKGVATAAGIMLGLSWKLAAAALGVWLAMALLFRISSLAALTAALAAPFLALWLLEARPEAWAFFPLAALLIWRHAANIRKLLRGEERRIGRS